MADIAVADGAAGQSKAKLSGRKLVLFVVVPAVLLLAAGGGAAMFLTGGGSHEETQATGEHAPAASKQVVFYDLPEMLVNLNTSGRQNHYLKLKVALELDDPAKIGRLETLLPRVIDNFQVFLRELRLEDLNGSTGMMRLKEELLIRVNGSLGDIRVNDVLFKEMLVQ